jgi:hypothetical protein
VACRVGQSASGVENELRYRSNGQCLTIKVIEKSTQGYSSHTGGSVDGGLSLLVCRITKLGLCQGSSDRRHRYFMIGTSCTFSLQLSTLVCLFLDTEGNADQHNVPLSRHIPSSTHNNMLLIVILQFSLLCQILSHVIVSTKKRVARPLISCLIDS